jgi:predicted P-loop ATPase
LENHPDWIDVLAYNEFTGGYRVRKTPPAPVITEAGKEIDDNFDTAGVRWLERHYVFLKPPAVHAVVNLVATRHSFHPVREYLDALAPWDGELRIGEWLKTYCGVIDSDEEPNKFAMAAGKKFLIAAVARILSPGAKEDHVLVLEGRQGIGKSTVVRILAGDEFYSDQLGEMGSKDASMQLRGIWIMELAELGQLLRAEPAQAKAFFSRQTERFRLPYGRRLAIMPRQCVFIGTINNDTWLGDETGNRRYWPVACNKIKLDDLRRDRDQLWAEALHLYRAGEPSYFTEKEQNLIAQAEEEQRARLLEDPWDDRIGEFLRGLCSCAACTTSKAGAPPATTDTSVLDILPHIQPDVGKWTPRDMQRIGRRLTARGWQRYQKRIGETREWRYQKPQLSKKKPS